ncbi:MAG: site-specific integrase, partial [Firmicutes bacterium]|nr:site-specific integrase [Bacillota bacterium]
AWQRQDMMLNGYRTDYVFTTSSGSLYDRQGVTAALERYYKRIGVPARGVHTYRRTFGTNLSKAGVPIEVASKMLGHSSIDITYKYYIGIEAEQKRSGIEKLALYLDQTGY